MICRQWWCFCLLPECVAVWGVKIESFKLKSRSAKSRCRLPSNWDVSRRMMNNIVVMFMVVTAVTRWPSSLVSILKMQCPLSGQGFLEIPLSGADAIW